jgi:hypothetical protein
MQGYIINISKVKDEDLLVTVLNQKKVKTLYRFYGARHSHIHLGYKIDYEAHPTKRENLFQLRNVSSLPYKWMLERDKFYVWQQFLQLLHKHLKDINEIDDDYFNLLEEMSIHLEKENPYRVAIESYAKLLDFEGRIHKDFNCFVCNTAIKSHLVLVRGFLPACKKCIPKKGIETSKIYHLFTEKNSILLNNNEVLNLYNTMLEGF